MEDGDHLLFTEARRQDSPKNTAEDTETRYEKGRTGTEG